MTAVMFVSLVRNVVLRDVRYVIDQRVFLGCRMVNEGSRVVHTVVVV